MTNMIVCLLIYLVLLQWQPGSAVNTRMTEVFKWKTLQFRYSSDAENSSALESGAYVPPNNLALGLERWRDKLFITVPRFKHGVYSTLNYVQLDETTNKTKDPLLVPYPNIESNAFTTGVVKWPPKLVSVTRVRADACDRLWVMDCGSVDLLTPQPKQMAPPKLVVYDLKTDKLLTSYNLRDKLDYTEGSLFPTVTVDVTSANCDHAFAYLPDVTNSRLVVYNLQTNDTHVISHNYFHFDPLSGDFANGGLRWQWQDGIFGLALSPVDRDGYRIVFFHALASSMEFAVSSKYLQNSTVELRDQEGDRAYKVMGTRGHGGQTSTSFLDEETGVLFYNLVNRHAVGCWNSFKGVEYEPKNQGVVAEDEDTLSFPNDMKVDKSGHLWVLVTPLPKFAFGSLDPKVDNFRVFSVPVRQAVKGTVCDEL